MNRNPGELEPQRIARWVIGIVLAVAGAAWGAESARASTLMDGVRYGESRNFLIVTAGAGWDGSVTDMAVEDFPSTKFEGSGSRSLSLRYVRVKKGEADNSGFGIDLDFSRGAMRLREQGNDIGTIHNTYVMATPGIQFWSSDYHGAGAFLGLLGLSYRSSSFTPDAALGGTGYGVEVGVESGWSGSLLPVKLDVPVTRKVAVGASFSGLMLGNGTSHWTVDGHPISGISTLYLSGWRLDFTVSLLNY